MITHEEVFTSPFPSPSRSRGRTHRFVPDYDYSPPSNRKMNINGTPTITSSAYRRNGPTPVAVAPVAAPSFTTSTNADHHRLLLLQQANRLNVPYDLSANTSGSTIKAATTATFTNTTKTTKGTTPPTSGASPSSNNNNNSHLHNHNHSSVIHNTSGSNSKAKRRPTAAAGGTERVIADDDFRRLQASLDSLQRTLKQTRSMLREAERNNEWFQQRVKVLDKRSRGLEVENRAANTRIKELEEENRLLRERELLRQKREEEEQSRILKENTAAAAMAAAYNSNVLLSGDDEKENTTTVIMEAVNGHGHGGGRGGGPERKERDKLYTDAIRGVVTQYWNMQTSLAVGATGAEGNADAACDCAAARAVQSILLKQNDAFASFSFQQPTSPDGDKDVDMADGTLNGNGANNTTMVAASEGPAVRIPPHPHPELFAKLRRVRKKVLRKRVKEMRGYIEALKGENEVLERVIQERGDEPTVDFDITRL